MSERLEGVKLLLKCKTCGTTEGFRGTKYEADGAKSELSTRPCRKCEKTTLDVEQEGDIIDSFLEFAEKAGTRVEVISEETEEGRMLRDSFGKVAAVLRYAVNK